MLLYCSKKTFTVRKLHLHYRKTSKWPQWKSEDKYEDKAVSFPVVPRVSFRSGPHISAPTDQVWIYSPSLDVSCAS